MIPKPHRPGKWRLITDFSSPEGASVNDGIDASLCSVVYTSVDNAINEVVHLGKGTLLVKSDLENAYRMVPVYPQDSLQLVGGSNLHIHVNGALLFRL